MSRYSGKCDLCDSFVMIGCDEDENKLQANIDRTNFYIHHGGHNHRLDIHCYKDLVPYFPYIVSVMCGSKEGRQTCLLSSKSWVDHEEEDFLTWALEDAKKMWRKCKRNKTPFSASEWFAKYCSWSKDSVYQEVGKRVETQGEKADIEGLHLPRFDTWDRKTLAEEMSRVGYTDFEISNWVYQGRDYDWRKAE